MLRGLELGTSYINVMLLSGSTFSGTGIVVCCSYQTQQLRQRRLIYKRTFNGDNTVVNGGARLLVTGSSNNYSLRRKKIGSFVDDTNFNENLVK